MANTKISEMTAATTHTGTTIPVVQSGANKKLAMSLLKDYKCYVALLTQSGTDAPIPTVLENSLGGTVVWARSGAGNYTGTLASAFTLNKTVTFTALNYVDSNTVFCNTQLPSGDSNYVSLFTYYSITDAFTSVLADFGNNTIFIEIRVYN